MLLPESVLKTLPPLYSQENRAEPVVHCKFFTPWAGWTWYVLEAGREGDDVRLFAWVEGFEKELGYVLLSELEAVRGPGGLRIERDLYFTPTPLKQIQESGE